MNRLELAETFQSPGVEYRGKPFWSWNGELDADELVRQAKIFKEMGFGGYFLHSRSGLITEYLGEDWFHCINASADQAEKDGMEAWLYDEDRWPSGSAGGKVTEDPQYRNRNLYLFEETYTPGMAVWDDEVFCAFAGRIGGWNNLTLADYRMLRKGEEPSEAFAALTGEGTDVLLRYRIIADRPNSNYNGNTYIDTMNRAAVDRFLELTHEEYQKHCGARMGSTIKGIFADEPFRGEAMADCKTDENGVRSSSIFYTGDIFTEFQKRYGYDALSRLPEIFYRLHGEPISPVRIAYFDLGCNLFNERFAMPINRWCEEHHILFTGHVLHENSLTNQSVPNGSLMRFYENMGYPGIDMLGGDNDCYWVPKQLSSVCRQKGKKWMLSELYGCTGWDFSFQGQKAEGNWQALFGINIRCPHLSWYTMEGESKRDYPGSISYQSPYWKNYEALESYFARFGLLMAEGKPVCDLMVLNPIESVWGLAHLDWARWIMPKHSDVMELENRYAKTCRALLGARVDFDYGEEQIIMPLWSIDHDGDGALLRVGECAYHTVLCTGALTLRSSTYQMLKAFLEAGGRVLFAGDLPGYMDGEHTDVWKQLVETYAGAEQVPFESFLNYVHPAGPIRCDANERVLCQVRKKGDDYIAVFLNTDRRKSTGEFHISYPRGYQVQMWNLETGERYVYPAIGDGELACTLEAADSLALIFTEKAEALPVYPGKPAPKKVTALPTGPYIYTMEEPNLCLLDYAALQWEEEPWREAEEVLRVDRHLRDRLGIERRGGEMLQPWFAGKKYKQPYGHMKLSYRFCIDVMPEGPVWLAAERPELQTYMLNGVKLEAPDLRDFWVDNAFIKMPIPKEALRLGENEILVLVEFKRTTNIEALYLIGDFGVRAGHAGSNTLIARPDTLLLGQDLRETPLPFYTGRLTYHIPAEVCRDAVLPNAEKIYLHMPDFSASLIAVPSGDGEKQRILAWAPYLAEVTETVQKGGELAITMVNSRRNSFGPMHIVPAEQPICSPGHFVTEGEGWTDDYSLIAARTGTAELWSC